MAKDSGQEKSLHELRQEIAHSRDRLGRDLSGLSYELDFPLKFRKSFQRNTVLWIAAAVVIGVVLVARPSRTKKVYVKGKPRSQGKGEEMKKEILGAGLAVGALRLAVTLFKPAVMHFISQKVRDYTTGSPTRGKR
jgi:hypothetical protein